MANFSDISDEVQTHLVGWAKSRIVRDRLAGDLFPENAAYSMIPDFNRDCQKIIQGNGRMRGELRSVYYASILVAAHELGFTSINYWQQPKDPNITALFDVRPQLHSTLSPNRQNL